MIFGNKLLRTRCRPGMGLPVRAVRSDALSRRPNYELALGGLTGQVIFVCGVPGKEREVSMLAPKAGHTSVS